MDQARHEITAASDNSHEYPIEISSNLEENLLIVEQMMGRNLDVNIRRFFIGKLKLPAAIVFIDNIVDKQALQGEVLRSLLVDFSEPANLPETITYVTQITEYLKNVVLTTAQISTSTSLDKLSLSVLSGDVILLLNGSIEFLIIGVSKLPARSVSEAKTETSVRGPHDGFIESVRTNMALIRSRLRDPNLTFESHYVGRRSRNEVVIAYVKGIAKQQLVEEVRTRLAAIDIDEAPESGYIEQLIEDNFLSPFPQIQHTERPDKVVTALIGGRVAVLIDGTPFVLVLPVTFPQLLQAPEDYYERWQIGTLIRFLRYISAFISVFLPALYIALVEYHPGLIPTELALSIAASREGVPFPAAIEALIMEVTIEVLREAGLRMPKPMGQTVSIVGGLVIGQAAVSAGIVSPIMVIIVALGAIASFSIPAYDVAIAFRMLRFGFMLAASLLGLYGIIIAYIFLNIHIVRLESFGHVFSAPFAPYHFRDWKDLVLRLPLSVFKKRPAFVEPDDETRAG